MKSSFRNHGLSFVLIGLFLLFWTAQFLVGRVEYNEEREERGLSPVELKEYFCSSHFWEATGENWESEFLQMAAYVLLTTFLFQKGSAESKDPDEAEIVDREPRMRNDAPGAVRHRSAFLLPGC